MNRRLQPTLPVPPETVEIDGTTYVRAYPVAPGRCACCGGAHMAWTAPRIVAALQAWATEHGTAPVHWNWLRATPEHPTAKTVSNVFGGWTAGLAAAGLTTRQGWTRDTITDALVAWSREHGNPPRAIDWQKASPSNPSSFTVKRRFGSWNAAMDAAGFFPRRFRPALVADSGSGGLVDAAPVAAAVRDYLGPEGEATKLAELMGVDESPLYRLLRGKRERMTHRAADEILTAIDRPDVMALLVAA